MVRPLVNTVATAVLYMPVCRNVHEPLGTDLTRDNEDHNCIYIYTDRTEVLMKSYPTEQTHCVGELLAEVIVVAYGGHTAHAVLAGKLLNFATGHDTQMPASE